MINPMNWDTPIVFLFLEGRDQYRLNIITSTKKNTHVITTALNKKLKNAPTTKKTRAVSAEIITMLILSVDNRAKRGKKK
jgi:hypothetical protein